MAMNQWLPGDRTKKKIYRKVLLLVIIIGFALAIAMSWCVGVPSQLLLLTQPIKLVCC